MGINLSRVAAIAFTKPLAVRLVGAFYPVEHQQSAKFSVKVRSISRTTQIKPSNPVAYSKSTISRLEFDRVTLKSDNFLLLVLFIEPMPFLVISL